MQLSSLRATIEPPSYLPKVAQTAEASEAPGADVAREQITTSSWLVILMVAPSTALIPFIARTAMVINRSLKQIQANWFWCDLLLETEQLWCQTEVFWQHRIFEPIWFCHRPHQQLSAHLRTQSGQAQKSPVASLQCARTIEWPSPSAQPVQPLSDMRYAQNIKESFECSKHLAIHRNGFKCMSYCNCYI